MASIPTSPMTSPTSGYAALWYLWVLLGFAIAVICFLVLIIIHLCCFSERSHRHKAKWKVVNKGTKLDKVEGRSDTSKLPDEESQSFVSKLPMSSADSGPSATEMKNASAEPSATGAQEMVSTGFDTKIDSKADSNKSQTQSNQTKTSVDNKVAAKDRPKSNVASKKSDIKENSSPPSEVQLKKSKRSPPSEVQTSKSKRSPTKPTKSKPSPPTALKMVKPKLSPPKSMAQSFVSEGFTIPSDMSDNQNKQKSQSVTPAVSKSGSVSQKPASAMAPEPSTIDRPSTLTGLAFKKD